MSLKHNYDLQKPQKDFENHNYEIHRILTLNIYIYFKTNSNDFVWHKYA